MSAAGDASLPNIHARHDGRPAVRAAFISSSSGPHGVGARLSTAFRVVGRLKTVQRPTDRPYVGHAAVFMILVAGAG